MGLDKDKLTIYQGNCHQHLLDILVDAGTNHLSSKLSHFLCDDLAIISPHLCVTCKIGDILFPCDKEFNIIANSAKGHGGMFHAWMGVSSRIKGTARLMGLLFVSVNLYRFKFCGV